VARLPRIRRPHLRERPINASTEPLATAKAPTAPSPAEAEEPKPDGAKPKPKPDGAKPKPEPQGEPKPAKSRLRRLFRRPKLPGRPKLPSRPKLPRPRRRPRSARRPLPRPLKLAVTGAVLLAAAVIGLAVGGVFSSDEESLTAVGPGPPLSVPNTEGGQPAASQAAAELGFPAFATKNTTRVGGADPAAVAAGVALATFPSAGGAKAPEAVTLVGEDDWAGGIAAAVLAADPVRAPILISTSDGIPDETEQAMAALAPQGGAETDGAQVFSVGDVDVPDDLRVKRIHAGGAAAVAAATDRLRSRLAGDRVPHVLIAPAAKPAFAMPAAAWAARSGDPVLFAAQNRLPEPTVRALKRHHKAAVYVLGPTSAISSDVVRRISRIAGSVRRVSGEDPVTNAIELARYADGSFGWNINDPGHGFVIARDDRPLDAAAAAPLSASGTWGPLLLSDSADTLPGALRGYLLDVKPGYRNDPTRAFYNHVWVIGDEEAISVSQQAAIDDLAELTRIGSGAGP
jgi:hypothetical protein